MKHLPAARPVEAAHRRIPRRIFMTWDTEPPPEMKEKMVSWIQLNPSYDFYLYDANDRATYIRTRLPPSVYNAYEELIPKAFKADLWRYCVLLLEGGVYVDSKCEAFRPLDDVIRDCDECVVPHDSTECISIGLLAFEPGHKILLALIQHIDLMCATKNKGPHPLALTGPLIFSIVFNIHYNIVKNMRSPCIAESYQLLDYNNSKIFMKNGELLCTTMYNSYKENSNPVWKHYPQLWHQDIVFKSKVSPAVIEFIERDIKDSEIMGVVRRLLGREG